MTSDLAAPAAACRKPRQVLLFTVALFVLALLPRLYVSLSWAAEPVWDGFYYDLGGRNLAAGLGYRTTAGKPWCHYPVGYSALLGLAYWLFGYRAAVAHVVNSVVGAALAVAVYRLARYVTPSELRARLAGILTAGYPGLILYSALLMTEPAAALTIVGAAWAALAYRGRRRAVVLAGLLLGVGVLIRPQSILCAPAIGLLTQPSGALRWGRLRKMLRDGAVATAIALAVVSPWTIRNCLVMDGCAFVSTNAGWNLAIGSFPRATGRFETLRSRDGCYIVTGQVQQDRCWLHKGTAWILADPGRWLAMIPKKLGYTFDHESFPIGYLSTAQPDRWPAERQRLGRAVLSTAHRILLCLAALGVVAWPRRRDYLQLLALGLLALLGWHAFSDDYHPFWPLGLAIPVIIGLRLPGRPDNRGLIAFAGFTIAALCLIHAVFFGEDRYHLVVTPLLCLLAACALRRRTKDQCLSGKA